MPHEQKTWEVYFRGSERPGRFSGGWLLAIHNHSYTVWKVKGTIRAGRKLYRRLFRLLGGKVQTSPQTVWKQAHLTGTQILLWLIFSIPHRTATDPTIYYSVVKQVLWNIPPPGYPCTAPAPIQQCFFSEIPEPGASDFFFFPLMILLAFLIQLPTLNVMSLINEHIFQNRRATPSLCWGAK